MEDFINYYIEDNKLKEKILLLHKSIKSEEEPILIKLMYLCNYYDDDEYERNNIDDYLTDLLDPKKKDERKDIFNSIKDDYDTLEKTNPKQHKDNLKTIADEFIYNNKLNTMIINIIKVYRTKKNKTTPIITKLIYSLVSIKTTLMNTEFDKEDKNKIYLENLLKNFSEKKEISDTDINTLENTVLHFLDKNKLSKDMNIITKNDPFATKMMAYLTTAMELENKQNKQNKIEEKENKFDELLNTSIKIINNYNITNKLKKEYSNKIKKYVNDNRTHKKGFEFSKKYIDDTFTTIENILKAEKIKEVIKVEVPINKLETKKDKDELTTKILNIVENKDVVIKPKTKEEIDAENKRISEGRAKKALEKKQKEDKLNEEKQKIIEETKKNLKKKLDLEEKRKNKIIDNNIKELNEIITDEPLLNIPSIKEIKLEKPKIKIEEKSLNTLIEDFNDMTTENEESYPIYKSPKVTANQNINVFTDGSYANNKGGIGIHFPNKEFQDYSIWYSFNNITSKIDEDFKPTYMELLAIQYTLAIIENTLPHKFFRNINIFTDSKWSIYGINHWVINKNKNLKIINNTFRILQEKIKTLNKKEITINLYYIPSHSLEKIKDQKLIEESKKNYPGFSNDIDGSKFNEALKANAIADSLSRTARNEEKDENLRPIFNKGDGLSQSKVKPISLEELRAMLKEEQRLRNLKIKNYLKIAEKTSKGVGSSKTKVVKLTPSKDQNKIENAHDMEELVRLINKSKTKKKVVKLKKTKLEVIPEKSKAYHMFSPKSKVK